MKSIWTPGTVRWKYLGKPHEAVLWTLWALSLIFLSLWLVGISMGATMGGWIHLLAGAAVLVGALCTYYVFKYGACLERPAFKRFHGPRFRRFRGSR